MGPESGPFCCNARGYVKPFVTPADLAALHAAAKRLKVNQNRVRDLVESSRLKVELSDGDVTLSTESDSTTAADPVVSSGEETTVSTTTNVVTTDEPTTTTTSQDTSTTTSQEPITYTTNPEEITTSTTNSEEPTTSTTTPEEPTTLEDLTVISEKESVHSI